MAGPPIGPTGKVSRLIKKSNETDLQDVIQNLYGSDFEL